MTAEMTILAPGDHGGDGWRLAAALGIPVGDVLDLSASLNPVAPDPVPVVAAHLEALRTYPDPQRAERELAEVMDFDSGRLVLTNGGSEAIALVAQLHPVGWVDDPDFSLYRRHLRSAHPGALRWRSNPHNPTGLLARPDESAAVWDEAFWPLATGSWTRGDADGGGDGEASLVLGSLTKLLACPGLRLGYVLCPDSGTAANLRRLRPSWSVNGPAVSALPELLAPVDLPKWAAAVSDLRNDLERLLRDAGYSPRPSNANWVLVDDPHLRTRLARAAISVRDCSSFGMPGTVRIAVPSGDGLDRLAAAL